MGKLGTALILLFAVGGAGCGGGSTSQTTSQADCQAFIETSYCPKVVTCFGGQIDQTGCVSAAQSGLDCSKAVGENGAPATCMNDISAATCDIFAPNNTIMLPVSCRGLFQLSP